DPHRDLHPFPTRRSSDLSGKTAAGADLQKQTGSGATVPVTTAQADAQDVAVELRNIGNVEAYSTVTIRSQVTGQITKVHFREGRSEEHTSELQSLAYLVC